MSTTTGNTGNAGRKLSLIERLPNEILAQILKDFEVVIRPDCHSQLKEALERRAPLLRLALCCKRLNAIVTPGKFLVLSF